MDDDQYDSLEMISSADELNEKYNSDNSDNLEEKLSGKELKEKFKKAIFIRDLLLNNNNNLKIAVGILGCANIARKNIRAIKKSKNCILLGIASRNIEKAKTFAIDNDVDDYVEIYGSYSDLLANEYINLIYLPLPTSQHLEWAIKVAEARKHILIEKPCALNSKDLALIMNEFEKRGLIFMDGVMFMHNPIMNRLRSTLIDPFVGKIARMNSSFSFHGCGNFFINNIRVKEDGDPLGALGDLGWYNIRLALISFLQGKDIDIFSSLGKVELKNLILPRIVIAKSHHKNEYDVPLDCDGEILFGTEKDDVKKIFRFDCSFLLPIRQTYEISLTNNNGYCDKVISGKYFVLPRCPSEAKFEIESGIAGYGDHATRNLCNVEYITENVLIDQEIEMFNTLGDIINSKTNLHNFDINGDLLTQRQYGFSQAEDKPTIEWVKKALYHKRISLLTQIVVDACYESLKNNSNPVQISYESFDKIWSFHEIHKFIVGDREGGYNSD